MAYNKYPISLKAIQATFLNEKKYYIKFWFALLALFFIIIAFVPWTQNIKSKGYVTRLNQQDKPQEIHSPIPGKIAKWYVRDGDIIKKGDTLLKIVEIKSEYLDPELIPNTQSQLTAKQNALKAYQNKNSTASLQIAALGKSKLIKQSQLENKIQQLKSKLVSEKEDAKAAKNEYELAKDQYARQQKMFEDGLVSQTQLQQRNVSCQNANAKKIAMDNKVFQTQQEIANTEIEIGGVAQDYYEKINKIEGEQFQSNSAISNGEAEVAKIKNQLSNYIIRNGMYVLLAPQDGQIMQSKNSGIGEIIKEGEKIMMVVPQQNNYAVEIFIRPNDLPLINLGQRVQMNFDGFPAIVFTGWPASSIGTFSGKIVAIESNINSSGFYRVLISEMDNAKPWPIQLKIGSGVQSIALLKDVPIYYELWRNINGFPPDFYKLEPDTKPKK
jgi:multidrug resistance efflux pump